MTSGLTCSFILPFFTISLGFYSSMSPVKKKSLSHWQKFLFICICLLSCGEFALTVISHSLVLRLALAHSAVILLLCCQGILENKVYFRTFRTVWTLMCGAALFGLCVTNAIHAFQMLTHRHDSGVHVPLVLLACSICDISIKEILLLESSSTTSRFGCLTHSTIEALHARFATFCFFSSPGISMLAISLMRIMLPSETLVLWVDPGLTVILCILLCVLITDKIKKHIMALILKSPCNVNVLGLKQSFIEEFPNLKCHHLHLWEEDCRIVGTAHIDILWPGGRVPLSSELTYCLNQIASFFYSSGVDYITLQPEIRQVDVITRNGLVECLYDCKKDHCQPLRCCSKTSPTETFVHFNYHDSYVSTSA